MYNKELSMKLFVVGFVNIKKKSFETIYNNVW